QQGDASEFSRSSTPPKVVFSGMEETPLEVAAQHAMNGARIVARQRRLIAELQTDGHDTDYAEALLTTFLTSQAIFEEHWLAMVKESGHTNRDVASMTPVSFLRKEKMERIARAISAGWMVP